ncbi:MAG: flagellar biosynthesis protein FlhB [Deltaproteobacteria bacterium]|nr:flagellar biosynthesis protein FlhB [Deltaproteobacteria bacterium]MBW1940380.1 flagellar biosynthesis protein FlhB [Deltaproteobacteria bacterium]MBW2011390.1 flagellar biosynthesis protein FlhB [Deltaproteobacteria bacterium]MBW2100878.1 flagellar biosynthesis protein FlhB [Deltaproteobacteria bacterium]
MSQGNDQEKTEQATPKRRQESREKGQVAKSKEVSSALILLASLGIFFFLGSWMFWRLSGFMGGVFQNLGTLRLESIPKSCAFLSKVFRQIFIILMPLMLAVLIAGIAGNLAQVGFLFTGKPLSPDFSRIDPIKGMKKIISLRSLMELVKSVIKIFFVGGIAFLLVRSELENIPALIQMSVGEILAFVGKVSFKICFYTCLALIVLAVLDYAFQRWQHEKDMKMTKQEVKEERKQSDGDPKIKARIRKVQMEMFQRRMMQKVPEATVIITNPTRLAIALKFEADEMIAPRVIAKGAGFIAGRIREIAKENDIPIVEHKPLAQTLFKAAEIGDFIPVDLYRAVAEILAYVYRLKGMRNKF